ncbi:UbiD family decarboxylase [Steroidobacter flavus]|uniref:UbiD family decarboxylase n=1 Tax=Steroidobacter flavus TaxID=1842136 RepID=A0ABV8T2E5_9GAMM
MKDFIEKLAADGELLIVDEPVNPKFELAAVTRKIQTISEKAVLFNNVAGTRLPVVSNLYGSHDRLCRLIGATSDAFCPAWDKVLRSAVPSQIYEHVAAPADLMECSLSDLPLITYHGKDAGPYFTSAIFLALEPDTGVPNLSFHRSMYVNDRELRVRLGSSHDLARYQKKAEQRGEALEAALLIGVPPEIFLSAGYSLPYEANELELAAKLLGGPVPMRSCSRIGLSVPAATEIVVEGRFVPNVRRPEGPFGEFLGAYVPVGDNHVFEVLAVTHRAGAYFHALTCGTAEDLRPLEALTAARVYEHVSRVVKGVLDVSTRPNCMISILKIRQEYEGHGKHALLAALGSNMDYNKVCMVVDEDVDIYDLNDVMWAFLTRGPADQRAMVLERIPGFYRDEMKDHWGRLAIDATMPWGRQAEFERKAIPGEEGVDLARYLRA